MSQLCKDFQAQPYLQAVVASSWQKAQLEQLDNSQMPLSQWNLAKLLHFLQISFLQLHDDTHHPLSGRVFRAASFAKTGSQYTGSLPLLDSCAYTQILC
jgi:hypothetical protein